MDKTKNNNDEVSYPVPSVIHSSLKLKMHFFYIFVILLFAGLALLPIEGTLGIFAILFSCILSLFFLINWLGTGVFKKSFIEINEDYICLKTMFTHKKTIYWCKITKVQADSQNNSLLISITKKPNKSFADVISALFVGSHSMSIPLGQFSTINSEKLYSTINYMAQNATQKGDTDIDKNPDEIKRSTLIALIQALLVSLIIGTIYGFTNSVLTFNLILIPIIGLPLILFVYFRKYNKDTVNAFTRIVFGLICACQLLMAPFVIMFFTSYDFTRHSGLLRIIKEYIKAMIREPMNYFLYYIFALVCFLIGATAGLALKSQRNKRISEKLD